MDARRDLNRTRVLIAVTALVAVVALVLAVLALTDDGDDSVDSSDTTSTTEEATSTTATTEDETTTSSTFAPTVDPAAPVWPRFHTSQRFDDPAGAARSFAVDFVGFTDPVVGELQAGDARSGEVPVRPEADGPVTTVLVRQLEDDTWFVIGAVTENVVLSEPQVGDDIDCPVRLVGEALAFEGHVDVAVRDDFTDEPIGTGFVTGGGGPSAPFDDTVDCDLDLLDDGVHHGSIVLTTEGGEDGRVWTAAVVRVRLK